MAKPNLVVVLESPINEFGLKYSVLMPKSMWLVVYNNKPIVTKTQQEFNIEAKYQRTCFAQKGSAENMANKFNKMFNTTEFSIREIT